MDSGVPEPDAIRDGRAQQEGSDRCQHLPMPPYHPVCVVIAQPDRHRTFGTITGSIGREPLPRGSRFLDSGNAPDVDRLARRPPRRGERGHVEPFSRRAVCACILGRTNP